MQHEDDDDDFNGADIEVAKEMREEGGGVEQLLAGLGNNDDANLLDIGDGVADDAGQSLSGDLLGGGGEGGHGHSQPPSGTENETGAEAAATADLLGL